MNPTSKRIIRMEEMSPGNIDAIWDDGNGGRYRVPVERYYEVCW